MVNNEEAWACGFSFGQELNAASPFNRGTPEDELWRQGWIQGALKKVGLPHYRDQMTQAFNRAMPLSPESQLWARKFEDRYFSE